MDLVLKTIDGTLIDVSEIYKNKPILVVFYHSSCLGCTGRALPLAYDLSKEFSFVQLIVVHVDLGKKNYLKKRFMRYL